MILLIDIGNTNIVFGIAKNSTVLQYWRIRTIKTMTSDELYVHFRILFQDSGLDSQKIKDIIITSVVPPLLRSVTEFSMKYFNVKPMIVGPELRTGIKIGYETPESIGADRIVNAAAAYEKYKQALLVVDFGTATTIDYITKNGEYMGGAIAPGLRTSSDALHKKASKLPRIETFVKPLSAIGKNTLDSLNIGILLGHAGMVDNIVNRIKKETAEDIKVIATGGLAVLFKEISETIEYVEESLTLEGLIIIYDKNRTDID